jgi:hypothetical protein
MAELKRGYLYLQLRQVNEQFIDAARYGLEAELGKFVQICGSGTLEPRIWPAISHSPLCGETRKSMSAISVE